MWDKPIISAVAVISVLLLVVLPGWFAERLEPIETAGDNIISYSEISSETNIIPYWQFNNVTSVPEYDETITTDSGSYWWWSGLSSYKNSLSSSWDVIDYWDYFACPEDAIETSTYLYLKGGITASQMLFSDVNNISIGIEYSGNYQIFDICWWHGGLDYFTNSEESIENIPIDWLEGVHSGLNWFNFSVPEEDLISVSTTEGMYDLNGLKVILTFPNGLDQGEVIETNFKVCPEYLIQEGSGENSTYSPFIQNISNTYHWYHWSLGIGGFLLCIVALFVTPFVNLPKIKKR